MRNQLKLLAEAILIGVILLLIVGCTSSEAPSSPISSMSPTPIPPSSIYQSEPNFSLLHPAGWYYEEDPECCISIASREQIQPMQNSYHDGEIVMEVINILDTPTSGFGDPLKALHVYTDDLGIKMPDQETVHNVNLDGKDFLMGTYSEKYIQTAWRGNRAPIFIGVYRTDQNTIIVALYGARNGEVQLRRVFEDVLKSIKDIPHIGRLRPTTQANTACTRRVGLCAFSGSVRGLKLVPAKWLFLVPPTRG
jgi:hypothetical protein